MPRMLMAAFRSARARSYREMHGLHLLVRLQLRRGAGEADFALAEDMVAVGETERHWQVLLDQQDREPLPLEAQDHLHDLLHDHRREPFRGLVEQEKRGVEHEG